MELIIRQMKLVEISIHWGPTKETKDFFRFKVAAAATAAPRPRLSVIPGNSPEQRDGEKDASSGEKVRHAKRNQL